MPHLTNGDKEPGRLVIEAPRREAFVGRQRELSQLKRALQEAQRGRGQIVLIGGEPGIGKTRLAREIAVIAATRTVIPLWGFCLEGAASPPYWPWAQIVRAFADRSTAARRRDAPGMAATPLDALVPQQHHHRGISRAKSPDAERFRLFDAVWTSVSRAGRESALLLVLEDLQWADRGSLLLLEFVAQQVHTAPVLLVATCRDSQVSQPLAQTYGELARMGARRVSLRGMTEQDTARLIGSVTGRHLSHEIVRAVHARSGGNPFFVTELARLPTTDSDAVPENVRDAVWRRLAPLSALARHLLAVASVTGREFNFRVIAAVLSDRDEQDLLRGLDEALEAVVVEPLAGRGDDWYQFKHELIRDALYDSSSPSRRARWHAAVVHAIEHLYGPALGDHAGELARHSAHAELLVGAASVMKYARMAGEQKLAVHAFADARPHFERAWQARKPAPFDAEAAAILFGLGCAQAATAVRWNRQEGWVNVRRAIEYYLQSGEVGAAVAAATHPSIAAEGASDVGYVIERILTDVPSESLQEGWLRARLGAAVYFETGDYPRARAAFDRALRIAARHRDLALEVRALSHETSVDHFDLRWNELLPKSRRALKLARRADDLHAETYVRYRAAFVLTNTGRADEARLEVEANLAAAERLRDHGLLADALYVASSLAQLRGAWGEARTHSDRGLTLSPSHLPLLHGRVLLEYETGQERRGRVYLQRLLEADRYAGPYPLAGVFTAITLSQTAALSTGVTNGEGARTAIRRVLARGAAIPNAVLTAHMARALLSLHEARAEESEAELEFLEPFAGVVPTQWCVAIGRLLGLLAHAAGHRRAAIARFEAASALCRRSGFRPELAWTCYDYASVLLETGSRHDRSKAAALIDEAERLAAELGMSPLATRIAAFRARFRLKMDGRPAGLTSRECEVLRLLATGRSNKEIAGALFISVNTVAVHIARILAKTGASNRTQAAAIAARHQLL